MDFFTFFSSVSFFNISVFVVAFYLLVSLFYGVRFASEVNFAYPNLLASFNNFSLFYLACFILLFAFDFSFHDSFYFFNENFQLIFFLVATLVLFVSKDFISIRKIEKFEYDILFVFVVLSC